MNSQKVAGCRCPIDQFIVTAVVYAQSIIDKNKPLKDKLFAKHRMPQPHVGVFTEQPIPETTMTYEQEPYTFYGILDYAIGFVSKLRRVSFKFFLPLASLTFCRSAGSWIYGTRFEGCS
jgi:hypothetical protein